MKKQILRRTKIITYMIPSLLVRASIEKKIEERKISGQNEERLRQEDIDLVVVRRFLYRYEAEFAKGLLSEKGIESIVSADDAGGMRPDIAFGRVAVYLLVKKDDFQRAQDALRVLGGMEET